MKRGWEGDVHVTSSVQKPFLLYQQTEMPTRGHKVLLVLEVEKRGCKKKLWS